MKKELTFREKEQLKKALLLIEEGLGFARDVLEDYEERNNFKNNFDELEKLVLELSPSVSEISSEVFFNEEDTDYLEHLTSGDGNHLEKLREKSFVINELSSELNKMTDIEEVNYTLKTIDKVMKERISERDKEEINNLLNWSIRQKEIESFKKEMYKKLSSQ